MSATPTATIASGSSAEISALSAAEKPRIPYPAPDSGIGTVEERRARYLVDVEEGNKMYRGIAARAFAGTASPRQAIKAKCLDCSNYQRLEVRHCPVILCPLHAYRPYQQDAAEEVDGD